VGSAAQTARSTSAARLRGLRWAIGKSVGRQCAPSRVFGLSTLSARGSDDEIGDITRLLADEPVLASGNSRMFPVDARTARVAETDIVMGTGIGQSEQLQDAIDQAVAAAMVSWPINAEGLPTVPSLAVMFFSSQYAQQGLGRVLPCLLRTFATTGGKPWKIGVSVVGCSAAGFDLEDKDTPAVSVTLIQGNLLTVVPFCAGDEAAGWSEADWSYKAGLKGLYDGISTSMVLLGHPSSEATTERALQHLDSAYPMSNKLGGIAGAAPGSDLQDRCVIFRKGTGVLNKKGKLLYGEDKNAAKYSTSDDLFFDGGSWRRSGLVGAAISGLSLDTVCLEPGGDGVKTALAKVAATKSIKKEDSLFVVGGLAFADEQGAAMLAPPHSEGVRKALKNTLNSPVAATILEKVLLSRESPDDFSISVQLATSACSLSTLYGADAGEMGELSDDELAAIESYTQDTLITSAGQILTIPKYEGPQKRSGGGGGGRKKGNRR